MSKHRESDQVAVAHRTAPSPPGNDLWAAANRDFDTGAVLRLRFTAGQGTVQVAVTTEWLKAWKTLRLREAEYAAVQAACVQIARDRIHPCLGKRRVTTEPIGAWMASPCPGVTLTWRPHWGESGVPVMLTLDADT